MNLSPSQRRGVLFGLLVGDAVGVPYEFNPPHRLPAYGQLDMQPPPGFGRTHAHVPVGTWSDDGALALALLDSLSQRPHLDLQDLAARMSRWEMEGHYTPDGRVFDIGAQTASALSSWRRGTPPDRSGGASEHQNGNGSLMRCASCLLVPFGSPRQLATRAMLQSLPTHAHPRSQVACALHVSIGLALARGVAPGAALQQAVAVLQEFLTGEHVQELQLLLAARHDTPSGTGYVVDSFWSAWHALSTTSTYADCVRTAVALGRDTDTTACIAGSWAGLVYGEAGIPAPWREALRGRPIVERLLDAIPPSP